ncbi:MAG TPA: hypothetical protein VFL29_10305 [Candidatus Dormibacteraeota bacterium]|nr:hypothetical protein [Candidatus Dormibacteraeota bacterium]
MSTVAWHVSRMRKRKPATTSKAFCELDGWSFDPRYTEGKCPICGWVAPGAPEAPLWLTLARRFEWEMAGLLVLLALMVVIALAVVHAAGYRLPWFGAPVHAAPGTIASQARTNVTASPSAHVSASAKPSSSPSKKP